MIFGALAEIALVETESANILADYTRENGRTVEMGVAGMPTAFTATYGSGKPVIGILGEFDALPGLSQKTTPDKQPWAVVACGGMSIGHKGLVHAAKALAMTMVDLYSDPQLVDDIRSEFDRRMQDKTYEAILPEGPPPVPTTENR